MRTVHDRRNRLKDSAVNVDTIKVPMSLGANCAGVERGASEIEKALRRRLERRGFNDILQRLHASYEIPVRSLDEARKVEPEDSSARYVESIAEATNRLAARVEMSVREGHLALVLGGDHSIAIGSMAGASSLGRLGVIWIDAHGDVNTPGTSSSHNIHGMPLAVSMGFGPPDLVSVGHRFDIALDDLVYIGVRDLERGEREWIRQSPSLVYTMTSIDTLGIPGIVLETTRRLVERGVDSVHISFDVDALDPSVLPGTGMPARGGLTYREAHLLMVLLRSSDLPIVSADIVELNPLLDPSGESTHVTAALTGALLGEDLT